MKEVFYVIVVVWITMFSPTANATYYTLVSCNYVYLPEFGRSMYVGVYKSQYGNLFTNYFQSYCPPAINQ